MPFQHSLGSTCILVDSSVVIAMPAVITDGQYLIEAFGERILETWKNLVAEQPKTACGVGRQG